MVPFAFSPGSTPLIISMPHNGTWIPDDILAVMTPEGRSSIDADHFQEELYSFGQELGATIIASGVSRYVIDLNRPKNDQSLYPGKFTTGLCPLVTFRNEPLYREGYEISAEERGDRILKYWLPYHETLTETISKTLDKHGQVLLYDAHSIEAELPLLFDGKLCDLNIGTNGGRTATPELLDVIAGCLNSQDHISRQDRYSYVIDGRFKGGYITRNYGTPALGVQTVQMELTKPNYMTLTEGSEPTFNTKRAAPLQAVLRRLLEAMLDCITRSTPS